MQDIWHVRGVDERTRKLAKEAAAKAGMYLGAWLTRAVENEATAIYLKMEVDPEKRLGGPGQMFTYDNFSDAVADGTIEISPETAKVADATVGYHSSAKAKRIGRPPGTKKGPAKCAHGVGVGLACWRCDGKAKEAE